MKRTIPYTIIFFLLLYSCHVQRIKKNYEYESAILENNISPSQDSSRTSIILKVVDLDTRENIPFAPIKLKIDDKIFEFEANLNGQILILNLREGLYELEVSSVGYRTLLLKDFELTNTDDVWLIVGLSAVY